jgi:hypothetical protein
MPGRGGRTREAAAAQISLHPRRRLGQVLDSGKESRAFDGMREAQGRLDIVRGRGRDEAGQHLLICFEKNTPKGFR